MYGMNSIKFRIMLCATVVRLHRNDLGPFFFKLFHDTFKKWTGKNSTHAGDREF
jgi:hypothetical protein